MRFAPTQELAAADYGAAQGADRRARCRRAARPSPMAARRRVPRAARRRFGEPLARRRAGAAAARRRRRPRCWFVCLCAAPTGEQSFRRRTTAPSFRTRQRTRRCRPISPMSSPATPAVDETSRSALINLSRVLAQRTSLSPGEPIGLDPARDELSFYPSDLLAGRRRPAAAGDCGGDAHRRLYEERRHVSFRHARRARRLARRSADAGRVMAAEAAWPASTCRNWSPCRATMS